MTRGVARVLAGLVLALAVFGWVAPASAAGSAAGSAAASGLSFDASLNGRALKTISSNDPLELSSDKPLEVSLSVTNNTGKTVEVAAARVQGRVLGLTFFNYDTQVGLKIEPGKTETSKFRVGLADLSGQAVGLLPTTVALLDENSDEIASKSIAVDVDGDLTSIYGVFGLAIAALTALWLLSLIVRVSRKTLPRNRWSRAVQFAVAGFGVGLTLTFSVSALSILTPNPAVWLPFVLVSGAIGLFVGYLTPGPQDADPDEEDEFIASRQSRQPALAGAGYGPPAVGGSPQQQRIEGAGDAPRPWQGEVERTPLGLQGPGAGDDRPTQGGADVPPPAHPQPGPSADDTVPRGAVLPRIGQSPDQSPGHVPGRPAGPPQHPQPTSGPGDDRTTIDGGAAAPVDPGQDDRQTIAGPRSGFDSFFRGDEPPARS